MSAKTTKSRAAAGAMPLKRKLNANEVFLALAMMRAGMSHVGVVAFFNGEETLQKMRRHELNSLRRLKEGNYMRTKRERHAPSE